MASGLRNCEIARRLWKSEKTIEKHVGHILGKLCLDDSVERMVDRRVLAAAVYIREITQSGDLTLMPRELTVIPPEPTPQSQPRTHEPDKR
jgi:hypothetical protein